MKIAVVVGRFPVVSEQFIVNHIVGLIESGHEVTILSGRSGDFGKAHSKVAEYGLERRLISAGIAESPIGRVIQLIGVVLMLLVTTPSAVFAGLSYKKYRTAAANGKTLMYYRRVRRERFDVLHAHFGANGLIGTFLKDMGIAPRLVTTFHGSDINTYPRRYGINVYRYLYQNVDAITCNTRFTGEKVVANGADRSRVHIIPVSLDTTDFPVREFRGDSEEFVLLTVGRLVEKKGHRYVLEALSDLTTRIPNIRYRIVGDGPLRTDLETTARDLGVAGYCNFLGLRAGADVRREYEMCDLFVLASVTAVDGDMEGQGLVLQEAQAIGVPVVTTRHNGIPDGVRDGETGLIVPEADVTSLADAILDLYANPARRAAMGEAGSRFVRENYDTMIIMKTMNEVYDAVSA